VFGCWPRTLCRLGADTTHTLALSSVTDRKLRHMAAQFVDLADADGALILGVYLPNRSRACLFRGCSKPFLDGFSFDTTRTAFARTSLCGQIRSRVTINAATSIGHSGWSFSAAARPPGISPSN